MGGLSTYMIEAMRLLVVTPLLPSYGEGLGVGLIDVITN